MKPIQAGGQWVIGRNFKIIDAEGIGHGRGRMAERTREIAQEFWHEDGWSKYHTGAVSFKSQEEARQYLEDNREQLNLDQEDQ